MSPARKLSDRHPFEIYLLSWSFIVSVPGAVGLVPVPSSVAGQLTGWPARVWMVLLALGSAVSLVGLAWHRPPFPLVSRTGLGLERVGLVTVGWATVYYAAAIVNTVMWAGLVPGGIVLAFGLACFAQARKIRRVLGIVPVPIRVWRWVGRWIRRDDVLRERS